MSEKPFQNKSGPCLQTPLPVFDGFRCSNKCLSTKSHRSKQTSHYSSPLTYYGRDTESSLLVFSLSRSGKNNPRQAPEVVPTIPEISRRDISRLGSHQRKSRCFRTRLTLKTLSCTASVRTLIAVPMERTPPPLREECWEK